MLHAARCKCRNQKTRQKSPSGHHPTTLSDYIFATEACIDNRKKNLLSSNISSTCPHNMVNFGLLAAEIVLGVCGTPATFNGFRVLAALLHGSNTSSDASWFPYCTDVVHRRSTKLWAGTLYITFSTGLLIYRNFCQVQN